MEVEKITVSVGITRNMGNYESLRLEYSLEIRVTEIDDWKNAIDVARTACNLKLEESIADEIEWFRGVGG